MSDEMQKALRYAAMMTEGDYVPNGTGEACVSDLLLNAADEIGRLRTALTRSMVAIDDWLHQYAGEMCDDKAVEESFARISEFGTVGYIANIQEQNRRALEQKP